MAKQPVYVIAKWRVTPGQLQNVLALVKELASKSRQEKGNAIYLVHQSNADENELILYESYLSEQAQREHIDSQHFKEIVLGKIVPLLEEREAVVASMINL